MKKIFTILCLTVLVCSQLIAGGSKEEASDGTLTLNVMHHYTKEEASTDNTRKVPRETFLSYEDISDINLSITEIQHNEYETKLQSLAAADNLPDVFTAKGSWIPNFVDNEMIADISDAVNDCQWLDEYRDGLYLPVTQGSAIYGAPLQFSATTMVYYNKALWEKIGYDQFPTTWEDLFAAIPKFEAMGIDTISFGNNGKWQYNSSWISALGPRVTGTQWVNDIIAQNNKAAFTDPEFIRLLDLTTEIGQSGALNPDYAVIGHQQSSSQFLQGKAACVIDGYWNVEYLASNASKEMQENIEMAFLPTVKDGKGSQTSIAAGCGWFVVVNSKLEGEALEEAKKLAMYVSGPVLSQGITDVGLIGTCKTSPSEGVELDTLHQKYINFVDSATETTPIWDANINASVIATMNDQFVELLAGRTTSEKAAKLIQEEYLASQE